MPVLANSLADNLQSLKERWDLYLDQSCADRFHEFILALNCIAEQCSQSKLPGLTRLCEELRHHSLAMSGNASGYPENPAEAKILASLVDTILVSAEGSHFPKTQERRTTTELVETVSFGMAKPRSIWLVSDESHQWANGLTEQLTFFGFRVSRFGWDNLAPDGPSPLVILFLPQSAYTANEVRCIQNIRSLHSVSQLFCLAVPELLDPMVTLLRAGADVTIPSIQETSTVLAHVLDLIEFQDQEPHRILVVEDSPTATAMIRRTLSEHGIDSHAISSPEQLLEAVWQYRPDLVLMDMHMPHCTGIEATRVLRQLPACQSLPVVYLSSETDMQMQVEALRLGGDQFIGKPFNPVLMSTVVKTKIERYREMQRSSQHDGLTGLLNHTSSKIRLNQLVHAMQPQTDKICVAMLDIDHFKLINDVHGHPVGDQVIRNLAWLLKGRLRTTDIIGRYGGEEFLIVLRGIGLDDALSVLDRIRGDFANLPHAHAGGSLSASFSAGIAAYPEFLIDKDLIDAADNALLQAKGGGRNCIKLARRQ
jgi:diguanylate cyclase (GGDEF)-like protein